MSGEFVTKEDPEECPRVQKNPLITFKRRKAHTVTWTVLYQLLKRKMTSFLGITSLCPFKTLRALLQFKAQSGTFLLYNRVCQN